MASSPDNSLRPDPDDEMERTSSGLYRRLLGVSSSTLLRFMRRLARDSGRPLGAAFLGVLAIVYVLEPPLFQNAQLWQFDTFQAALPNPDLGPVVIIDIDEESLARFGQWPWPRSRIAKLVDAVADAGPVALGIDILFPEADSLSLRNMLDAAPDLDPTLRARILELPTNDDLLAEALSRLPTVLGMAALPARSKRSDARTAPRTASVLVGEDPRPYLWNYADLLRSIDTLSNAAAGNAALTVPPEVDGVVRRIPMAVAVNGAIYPALSVEMLRLAADADVFAVMTDDDGVRGIAIADLFLPTARDGRAWIRFGSHRPERYISAADVIDGRLEPGALDGMLALLGSTGLGINDFVSTSTEANMPGVEVHAQFLESVIAGTNLVRPRWAKAVEVGMLLVAGLIVILTVPQLPQWWRAAPLLLTIGLLGGGAWYLFARHGLLIDAIGPAISSAATFVLMLSLGLAAAEQARRQLREDLARQRAVALRVEGELAAAREIQMGILPRIFPAFPHRHEIDLHAAIEPAREVGGDLYDFAFIDEHRLFFMIGDVSGKGVPASLFMAVTKALCKAEALRGDTAATKIDAIVADANAAISRENPGMLFVTAFVGILDTRTGVIAFCNAGHEPPYVLTPEGPPRLLQSIGGPPLCTVDEFAYPQETMTLSPGNTLVLYTDGVPDARNNAHEPYGAERLTACLSRLSGDADAETVCDAMVTDVRHYAAGAPPIDDITVLILRFSGPTKT